MVAAIVDIDGDGAGETFIGLPRGPLDTQDTSSSTSRPLWSGVARIDGIPPTAYIEIVAGATWQTPPTADYGTGATVVGDVTGDAVPDLGLVRVDGVTGDAELRLFTADASGVVSDDAWTARVVGEDRTPTPCGDLDGDGVDDLWVGGSAWAGPLTGELGVRDASLTLTFPGRDGQRVGPWGTVAGDLDGTGRPDLLTIPFQDQDHLYAFTDPGWGSYTEADARITWTLEPADTVGVTDFTLSDLDGDGAVDLVVRAWSPQEEYAVYVADAGGGSLADATTRVQGGGFERIVDAGDMDGDGQADLAMTAPAGIEPATVWVLRGPLDGGVLDVDAADVIWTVRSTFGEAARPWSMATGDLDGDGAGELLLTVLGTNDGSNAIVVLPSGGL